MSRPHNRGHHTCHWGARRRRGPRRQRWLLIAGNGSARDDGRGELLLVPVDDGELRGRLNDGRDVRLDDGGHGLSLDDGRHGSSRVECATTPCPVS